MIITVNMDQWLEDNRDELSIMWAENGTDRELDFDLECEEEKAWEILGKLKVMRSNAGYYIGRSCPLGLPYCRESDYYSSKDDAERALYKVSIDSSVDCLACQDTGEVEGDHCDDKQSCRNC